MAPDPETPKPHSNHYRILGDYACARRDNHVFFFRDRHIYYGGQILGSREHGAFYLNGQRSPLGRIADAPLAWDESGRSKYEQVEQGLFTVNDDDDEDAVCQPFLIRFADQRDLSGTYIESDQAYFELGEYPYPLPSNTISGMGFCTLTPGEVQILLRLMEQEAEGRVKTESNEQVTLGSEPVPYSPSLETETPATARTESHLEAMITANPAILPEVLRPNTATLCRQVPISPFKPRNMDAADICYFGPEEIRDGTIPNTVIELKNSKAGKQAAEQVVRYLRWLHKRLGADAESIAVYVYAPSFTRTFSGYIPTQFRAQVQRIEFSDEKQSTLSDRS